MKQITNKRIVFAEIAVNDDKAIRANLGTLDYLANQVHRVHGCIELCSAILAEKDSDSEWERYINYLSQWAICHNDEKYAGMSPACFEEWRDNEDKEDQ